LFFLNLAKNSIRAMESAETERERQVLRGALEQYRELI
jgi:hypothetical protein